MRFAILVRDILRHLFDYTIRSSGTFLISAACSWGVRGCYFFVSPVKPVCFIKLLSYGKYFSLFVVFVVLISPRSGIFKLNLTLIYWPNKVKFLNNNSNAGLWFATPQILLLMFIFRIFTFRLISLSNFEAEMNIR